MMHYFHEVVLKTVSGGSAKVENSVKYDTISDIFNAGDTVL